MVVSLSVGLVISSDLVFVARKPGVGVDAGGGVV